MILCPRPTALWRCRAPFPGWVRRQGGRVYSIDADMIARAARIVAAIEEVARILHGEKGEDK